MLVDAVGRKKLFYFGLTGMGSMLVLLGLAFHFGASSWGLGVLAILLVYIGCYSLSISPLFWLMTAELFPNRLRGYGASSATVANWSANLLITLTFLSAVDALGKDVVFWIYAAVAAAGIVFVRFCMPGDQGPCAGRHRRVLDRGPRMAGARPRDLLDDTVSAASQQIIQEIRASNSPDGASGWRRRRAQRRPKGKPAFSQPRWSGSSQHRPELDACLDHVRAGDTLVVWRLDRLGRSLRHLIETIGDLRAAERWGRVGAAGCMSTEKLARRVLCGSGD